MSQKTIKVHADLSKEYMYNTAIENGLSEKAADYFKYFNEVEVTLTVNQETGEVLSAEGPGEYT